MENLCILKLEHEADVIPVTTLGRVKATGQPGEVIFSAAISFLARILRYFISTYNNLPEMRKDYDFITTTQEICLVIP